MAANCRDLSDVVIMLLGNRRSFWAALKYRLLSNRVVLTSTGVAGCVILLRCTGILQVWEWTALDQFFCLRPLEPTDERIVIVGINETDLKKQSSGPFQTPSWLNCYRKFRLTSHGRSA